MKLKNIGIGFQIDIEKLKSQIEAHNAKILYLSSFSDMAARTRNTVIPMRNKVLSPAHWEITRAMLIAMITILTMSCIFLLQFSEKNPSTALKASEMQIMHTSIIP